MATQRDKVTANAEKLVAKGKIEPAIKEYERLLDDNPNDVNTLNRIGDLWVRINRTDQAVKAFSRIADHYAKDGFFLKAIAIYKKINKLDPSKLDVYAKLADLYAKQGLAMEAKSQYQVLADYYVKHGDPASALIAYRKIAELDPNSINVHVKLADLYSQANQTTEALKEYDRVGRMLLKRGMLEEAVQVFKKALKIDPANIELVESLVTTLLESKDYANATSIIESALEISRANPKLVALLGRTYLAKGELPRARKTLEQGLSLNPNDSAIREGLADLYLRQNAPSEALNVMLPAIDSAAGRAGVEMLNRVLRIDQSHIPTLEKLVSVYTKLNEETNILASMNSLAEAHMTRGDFDAAARVLQDLIKREPENAQHRKKLAFIEQQRAGGSPAYVAPPPTAPIPAEEEIEELPQAEEISFEPSGEAIGGEELSIDLDASEPIDLGPSFRQPEPAPPPPPPPPAAEQAVEVDMSALESDTEDLDFITEHLTEAEVFAKYGLAEKAIEHLQTIIERAPKHVGAHERLLRIYMDEGNTEGIRKVSGLYIALLREIGEDETADQTESELRSGGYLEAAASKKRAAVEEEPVEEVSAAEMEEAEVAEEALSVDLEAPPEVEVELEEVALDTSAGVEPFPEETLGAAAGDVVFDTPTHYEETPVAATEPSAEELGEVDFYLEQELFDEARQKVDALLARFPDHQEVLSRDLKVEAAAKKARAAKAAKEAAKAKPAPPPPAREPAKKPAAPPMQPFTRPAATPPKAAAPKGISAEDIESELMSALPGDEEEPLAAAAAAAGAPRPAAAEENLFADEEDFFDLAAELEEELEQESKEALALSEEEQSLEEIFKEFKKGVEQQLDSEDYDTHYNLGIAYKEMGLIDEAIGEFQLASKDPKRTIECCSMLGLCFMEKAMPQLAVKWYLKGLEAPEISEEELLGLRYDLGSAYAEMGEVDSAHKAFMEIYGVNSHYRDVASRLKQLEGARR